jgi:hypothetical protein
MAPVRVPSRRILWPLLAAATALAVVALQKDSPQEPRERLPAEAPANLADVPMEMRDPKKAVPTPPEPGAPDQARPERTPSTNRR